MDAVEGCAGDAAEEGAGCIFRSAEAKIVDKHARHLPFGGAKSLAFGGTGGGHVAFQGMGVHVDIFGYEDLDDIACRFRGGTEVAWAFRPSHLKHTGDDETERFTGGLGKDVREVPAIGL
jgi:hypothetical protein